MAGRAELSRIIRAEHPNPGSMPLLGCPGNTTQILGCRLIDFFGPNSLTAADVAYIRSITPRTETSSAGSRLAPITGPP